MKNLFTVLILISILFSCTIDMSKDEKLPLEPHEIVDVKTNSSSFIQENYVGVYEADKHHGGNELYIEKDYVMLIDRGLSGEINYSYIGTFEMNNDTLELKMKFSFDRLGYLRIPNKEYQHSNDWVEFSIPNDTIIKSNMKQFRFLPTIIDSDTLLIRYHYNEEGFSYKKIK